MERREFLKLGAVAAVSAALPACKSLPACKKSTVVAADDFWAAVKVLETTRVTDYALRTEALATTQKWIYALKEITAYNPYYRMVNGGVALDAASVAEIHRDAPVMAWYDRAFERVLAEVQATEVTGRKPAIWYVYNMGIIVKTATCTFSVDLCHRLAAKAVPILDFALVSHNHDDHFTDEFLSAMNRAKKPVISNFYLQPGSYSKEAESEREIKGVRIRCVEADHNPGLKRAVMCFEISCDDSQDPYVIFHSGDCHRADQLRPRVKRPDMYIGHCAIGLDFIAAYKTTMPAKRMVIAHHQELGHLWSIWRCVGFHEEPKYIHQQLHDLDADVILPVWGDRID